MSGSDCDLGTAVYSPDEWNDVAKVSSLTVTLIRCCCGRHTGTRG